MRFLPIAAVAFLVACGSGPGNVPDAADVIHTDAGHSGPIDASDVPDANDAVDAGDDPVDAGETIDDAGVLHEDAGEPPPDADAGEALPDAGDTTIDAGSACEPDERLCMGLCRTCPTSAGLLETACTGGTCIARTCAEGYVLADGTCLSTSSAELAPLFDPERISLPHECSGTPLTAGELEALFPRGFGRLSFREGTFEQTLGSVPRFEVRRTCHPVTGCTVVSVEREWGYDLNAQFELATDGAITFATYSTVNGTSNPVTGRVGAGSPVDDGDFIIDSPTGTGPAARGLVVRTIDGSVCFSTVSGTAATTGADYSVTRVTIPVPAEGSDRAGTPPFPDDSSCTGEPASSTAIATAWFPPGSDEVIFPTTTGRTTSVFRRVCHARTGCTAWRTMEVRYTLEGFGFAEDFSLQVMLKRGSFGSGPNRLRFGLVDGRYSGTAALSIGAESPTFTFSGMANASCVDERFTRPTALDTWFGPGAASEEHGRVRVLR